MATAPIVFTDAVDSFYNYVRDRIETINPNRVVQGILNAQDWPKKPLVFDAFYLLVINDSPIGKQGYSPAVPILFHQVNWTWVSKGQDTQPNARQPNRGLRYRTSQTMKGELLQALFPGSTEKLTWSMNQQTGKFTGVSLIPKEFIMWQPVSYHEKQDQESSMVYCTSSLRVVDMIGPFTS